MQALVNVICQARWRQCDALLQKQLSGFYLFNFLKITGYYSESFKIYRTYLYPALIHSVLIRKITHAHKETDNLLFL